MLSALIRTIDAQNPDEVGRQYDFLRDLAVTRLVLTGVAYALAVMFLPFGLCLVLAAIDSVSEILCLRWMKGLNPAHQRARYIGTLLCVSVAELCYMTAATKIWQLETPFARPFAIALIAMSMVQLLTVRCIHLPYGLTGWITLIVTAAFGAFALWAQTGAFDVLLLSLISIAAAAAFILSAMLSNHALHVGLVQGQAAARAADRAKGRFLAQMSHELRTPLNAIIGMGEAELAGVSTEASQTRMRVLVSSARGLATILDDILHMSAIGHDRLTIRPICAGPAAEIGAVTVLFEQVYRTAGLALTTEFAENIPLTARFDAQRLRQCLTNLLSNALKFTTNGGADVLADMAAPDTLRIMIRDTGTGIAANLQDNLFQPFERGLTAQSGSGLGLSISRALARAMGGDLVLMQGAVGAAFCLTIKVAPVCTDDLPQPLGMQPDLSHCRILVVDDIATNRLVAATYLRQWGVQVTEAADGASAIAQIALNPPDLVLLDLHMPGLSGAQTLDQIRALPGQNGSLAILAMTANAAMASHLQGQQDSFDGWMTKPLTPESLIAAILPFVPDAEILD